MTKIEDLINHAARTGKFNLTVWDHPTAKDRPRYQANFSRDKVSWRIKYGDSPLKAITLALESIVAESKPVDDDDRFKDLLG